MSSSLGRSSLVRPFRPTTARTPLVNTLSTSSDVAGAARYVWASLQTSGKPGGNLRTFGGLPFPWDHEVPRDHGPL